jgi:hypothetical protein
MNLAVRLRAARAPANLGARFIYAAPARSVKVKSRLQPRNKVIVACTTHSTQVIRDEKPLLFIYRSPSAHDSAFGNQIMIGAIMKRSNIEILPTEELWVLHEKVAATLKAKIIAEKKVLEDRLSQLNGRFRV